MDEWIVVHGLTSLELRELEDAVGAEGFLKEATPHESGRHLEPGMITAVVVVSAVALNAIIPFLNKSRRRKHRKITIDRITEDGTTTRIQIEESVSEEDALDSETVKALADGFSVDPSALLSGSEG